MQASEISPSQLPCPYILLSKDGHLHRFIGFPNSDTEVCLAVSVTTGLKQSLSKMIVPNLEYISLGIIVIARSYLSRAEFLSKIFNIQARKYCPAVCRESSAQLHSHWTREI